MRNKLTKDEKSIIAFLATSFIFVLAEVIVSSFILFPTMSLVYLLAFALNAAWFIYSLYEAIKKKRKLFWMITAGSIILMISFALSSYYNLVYSLVSGSGAIYKHANYEFPGSVFLYQYDGPIYDDPKLVSKDLVFFLPDFIVWVVVAISTSIVVFFQRRKNNEKNRN